VSVPPVSSAPVSVCAAVVAVVSAAPVVPVIAVSLSVWLSVWAVVWVPVWEPVALPSVKSAVALPSVGASPLELLVVMGIVTVPTLVTVVSVPVWPGLEPLLQASARDRARSGQGSRIGAG
jgi:hypothetical protein